MRRAVPAILLLAAIVAFAGEKNFNPPRAYHANTYPARDAQPLEKVVIAADPYDMPDKAAPVFVVDYRKAGFLPIHLIISNDGDKPITFTDLKVELVTVDRVKIAPATPDDIYRRIARLKSRPGDQPKVQVPIPIPRRPKGSISPEAQEEIAAAKFLAKAVEPHATQAGFLFFDVADIPNPLAGARLFVSGIVNDDGQELIYFEISMEKYLGYKPPTH